MSTSRARTVSVGLVRSLQRLAKLDTSPCDSARLVPGARLTAAACAPFFERFTQAVLDGGVDPDANRRSSFPTVLEDEFPQLTSLLTHSRSMGWALRSYANYRALIGEPDNLIWRFDAHSFEVEYHAQTPGICGALAAVGNFKLLTDLVRRFEQGIQAGTTSSSTVRVDIRLGWPVSERILNGLPVGHCVLMRGAPPRFKVTSAFMWTPVPQFDAERHALVTLGLDIELVRLRQSGTLIDRIRTALTSALDRDDIENADGLQSAVCERLAVSRWTLRRQLDTESVRFQDVVDQWRIQQALERLADERDSILEISSLLGFSSPGSFTRFCQTQLHATPSHLRRALTQGHRPAPWSAATTDLRCIEFA